MSARMHRASSPSCRDAANAVVRLAVAVERDVEIEINFGILPERAPDRFRDVRFDDGVRRDDDAAHAVAAHEEIDDVV